MIKLRRYFLLNKRLYKQLSYVILLIIIPVAVFLLRVTTQEKGHLMSVGIYAEDKTDETTKELLKEIFDFKKEFLFTEYDSEQEAVADVQKGVIEEAWIIPDGIGDSLLKMAAGEYPRDTITLYLRETGVTHYLMKEILESCFFKLLSDDVFKAYVIENFEDSEGVDDVYINFYNKVPESSLFKFSYLDGETSEEADYLIMPIRGLLAILLLITGIAGSVYYIEDEKHGLFIYWHSRTKNLRALGYYSVVMFNSTLLVLASLFLAGIGTNPLMEILNLLIYDFMIILFSMILRTIFPRIKTIGVVMPLVVILSILLSPVFIDFKSLRVIETFVPSFHYLMSTHSIRYTYFMLIYCVVEIVILEVLSLIKKRIYVNKT